MKAFDTIGFDFAICRAQVDEFEQLLAAKAVLKERRDILPFFRDRTQLSALCSVVSSVVTGQTDRIAWEYDLFGDFACDLVVGDWARKCYCFIEFEDATPRSLFQKVGKKATRDWSSRFEHGCSQTIDWIHKLAKMAENPDYEARFGKRSVDFDTAVIIGRLADMDMGELGRFEWRRDHVLAGSKRVCCVTFDELLERMKTRLDALELLAKSFPTPAPLAPAPPTASSTCTSATNCLLNGQPFQSRPQRGDHSIPSLTLRVRLLHCQFASLTPLAYHHLFGFLLRKGFHNAAILPRVLSRFRYVRAGVRTKGIRLR